LRVRASRFPFRSQRGLVLPSRRFRGVEESANEKGCAPKRNGCTDGQAWSYPTQAAHRLHQCSGFGSTPSAIPARRQSPHTRPRTSLRSWNL
jgi:hypothetical protein